MEQELRAGASLFPEYYERSLGLPKGRDGDCPSLVLAYLGDGLYDLFVRDYVIFHYPGNIRRMNEKKKRLVCASAQSEIMGYLIGRKGLTEREMAVYRRARNHRSESRSKNSTILDYRRATGFEALLGDLYLRREGERLMELVSLGIRHLEGELHEG